MNSKIFKFFLLVCFLFQVGCDISFKRKSVSEKVAPGKKISIQKGDNGKGSLKIGFNKNDSQSIKNYYADESNAIIKKDMLTYSSTSKEVNDKLIVGNFISRDIQVIPLPLNLERKLSSLPLDMLRVQVGIKVILMNVKSRKILDMIVIQ